MGTTFRQLASSKVHCPLFIEQEWAWSCGIREWLWNQSLNLDRTWSGDSWERGLPDTWRSWQLTALYPMKIEFVYNYCYWRSASLVQFDNFRYSKKSSWGHLSNNLLISHIHPSTYPLNLSNKKLNIYSVSGTGDQTDRQNKMRQGKAWSWLPKSILKRDYSIEDGDKSIISD